jgi:uncharacterized protein YegP (UPF0339 family)
MKLTIYNDKRNRYRFRVTAMNGNILARSPRSYSDKGVMLDRITRILAKEHDAEQYRDVAGEWRWRLSLDGEIIIIASEGYTKRSHCLEMSDKILDGEVDDGTG